MTPLVMDNSIVLSWCLADEDDPLAERAIEWLLAHGAVAPGIWWYELKNALIVNERRGRLRPQDTRAALADIAEMPITIDAEHDERTVLDLARRYELSAYDASYLEVAARRALPLATLDRRLRRAAAASHIPQMPNAAPR